MRYAVLVPVFSVVLAGPVFGQAITGTIFGNVSDPSGGMVAGAAVRAVNTLTSETHSTSSNVQGAYLFPVLPAGRYRLEAEAQGFKKAVRDGLTVGVNQNARVDVALEIGSVTQEVRVVADAPLVDTREAQLGGTVDRGRVVDLPLNGRNVYSLVSILPGVTRVNTLTLGNNEGNFVSVNGSRMRQTNFLLDGGANNSFFRNGGNQAPNPDAVQEFRLITSNFDAEFGRLSGAVVNVVTRSGTNELHGTLFEFLRNNRLNARNFFQPTVSALHQNQFGATAGGPAIRNKTFVFGSYQGLRVRNAAFVNSAITPTEAQRRGDFSAFPAASRPVDPATASPFPGGLIPQARLDPVAQNILKLVPQPNTADGRVQASDAARTNEDQGLLKIDHQLAAAHKLYGSLFLIHGSGFDPFGGGTQIPQYGVINSDYRQRNVVVNEDWIATPALLNQARFSYSHSDFVTSSPISTSWSDFGSKVTLGAMPPRLPQIFVNGFWQMGTFGEGGVLQKSFGFSDTLRWMRGAHSLKAGGGFLRKRYIGDNNWLGAGQVRFTGATTRNSMADFMLGQAASFRQNNGGLETDMHASYWNGFIQDDWKAGRRLTMNLGLRWEVDEPFINDVNALQTFRFGVQSKVYPTAPLGILFSGDPGVPEAAMPTHWKSFAPRIGLAFDVFGNGKTAIRAAYGIFYGATINNITCNLNGQPFTIDVTMFTTPNLIDPWASVPGGSPFPYKVDPARPRFALPVTASYVGENQGVPYVQQYNLTIQQQLAAQWGLQVAYVGNASRKLYLQRDANAPVFIPGASTTANVNSRRPYLPGTFGEIAQNQTAANAHYDSLQVSLNRRFAGGWTLMANYTWSKSIDISSDDQLNPTVVSFVNSNNLALDRAPSEFDTPHRFVVSYLWEVPRVERWGLFGKHVLGGWQFNGVTTLRSGSPVNVVSGTDTNFDGIGTDRPDVVGDPKLDAGRPRSQLIARYFNTAAFRAASGLYGSASRNLIYAPGAVNWDFSGFKNFAVMENKNLQFRAEFFNLFNQVNFGGPNATLTSPSFGRILGASAPRIVQFGLKFVF